MEPFFSIVTVCLNAGDSLLQTIETVLKQDFKNFELIVKDGFSTDDSIAKIQKDKKIVFVQKKDGGIYDAMNQALEYTNGQYVLFLNAGDFFCDSSVLDSFYEAIINNNFPALVYCDNTTTGLGEYVQSPPRLTNFFLFRTSLCHQVCMIKREYYDRLGQFDTRLKVEADYDFLLRLIYINRNNYKHIQKLGIIYTSGGFAFQNRDIAKAEVKMVRKKYFSSMYLYYNTLLALTFPSLRIKIVNRNGIFSKIYQRFVNKLNRI